MKKLPIKRGFSLALIIILMSQDSSSFLIDLKSNLKINNLLINLSILISIVNLLGFYQPYMDLIYVSLFVVDFTLF